jgi:hypothetical protein
MSNFRYLLLFALCFGNFCLLASEPRSTFLCEMNVFCWNLRAHKSCAISMVCSQLSQNRNCIPGGDGSRSLPQIDRRHGAVNCLNMKPVIQIPLSDTDWTRVKHLFPESEIQSSRGPGRPRRNVRDIVDAILWIQLTGEKWHRLPSTFPPTQTCYTKFCVWRRAGIVQVAMGILDISPPAATVHGRVTG